MSNNVILVTRVEGGVNFDRRIKRVGIRLGLALSSGFGIQKIGLPRQFPKDNEKKTVASVSAQQQFSW